MMSLSFLTLRCMEHLILMSMQHPSSEDQRPSNRTRNTSVISCRIGWYVGMFRIIEGIQPEVLMLTFWFNKIKKEEVRKRGKKSVARRPFELKEFAKLVSMLRADQDPLKKYGYSALVCLQLHFLARIDDTCAVMVDEIWAHHTYKNFAYWGEEWVRRMCGSSSDYIWCKQS